MLEFGTFFLVASLVCQSSFVFCFLQVFNLITFYLVLNIMSLLPLLGFIVSFFTSKQKFNCVCVFSSFLVNFRYVHGIGSETRNSLFHLHNGRDIILVTTCRHGKSWRELQDARCDEDNREYDRYVDDSPISLIPSLPFPYLGICLIINVYTWHGHWPVSSAPCVRRMCV